MGTCVWLREFGGAVKTTEGRVVAAVVGRGFRTRK